MGRRKALPPIRTEPYDQKKHGDFLLGCKWVAIDHDGRKCGADTEDEARKMSEDYNRPKPKR